MANLTGLLRRLERLVSRRKEHRAATADEQGGESKRRRALRLRAGLAALVSGVLVAVIGAGPAWAASGVIGADAGAPPGLGVFDGLDSWIKAYGLAGAPVAVSLGGLLFAVEHHQQRTGNAIRAKGYVFAACAGLIVISLAGTITGAAGLLAH